MIDELPPDAIASPGMRVEDLDTPTVVVDLDRMERNIAAWQTWMDGHRVKFRVHVKTHKVPDIALRQLAAGACGIACAKVSEAEPFAAAGIDDICIAYPVVGERKWARVAELARAGTRMTVNCDDEAAVDQASAAAQAAGVTIHLQVDVDSGLHRGGLPIEDPPRVEALARHIESRPNVEFDGITTFRFYFMQGARSTAEEGHHEGRAMVDLADLLRSRGLEVREVTAGSSFTGRHVAEVPGITEVRAGTYVFFDLMHRQQGNAREDDLAATVLAEVVSRQEDRFTVDAGSKTFSGDAAGAPTDPARPPVMARVLDSDITLERFMEEHGIGRTLSPLRLGEKLRFVPYHVCTCVNLSDQIVGVRSDVVETVWPVTARGLRA